MPHYSVATTKDQLSSLIDKALAGEEVVITRHGKPTVELRVVAAAEAPKPSDDEVYERLRKLRESSPPIAIPSVDLIRQMRDEGLG